MKKVNRDNSADKISLIQYRKIFDEIPWTNLFFKQSRLLQIIQGCYMLKTIAVKQFSSNKKRRSSRCQLEVNVVIPKAWKPCQA